MIVSTEVCSASDSDQDPDGRTVWSFTCDKPATVDFIVAGHEPVSFCGECAKRARSEWSEQGHEWFEWPTPRKFDERTAASLQVFVDMASMVDDEHAALVIAAVHVLRLGEGDALPTLLGQITADGFAAFGLPG